MIVFGENVILLFCSACPQRGRFQIMQETLYFFVFYNFLFFFASPNLVFEKSHLTFLDSFQYWGSEEIVSHPIATGCIGCIYE